MVKNTNLIWISVKFDKKNNIGSNSIKELLKQGFPLQTLLIWCDRKHVLEVQPINSVRGLGNIYGEF